MARLLFALLLTTTTFVPAMAADREATRQEIEAARQDIAELRKLLEAIESQKSGVQKELESTEKEMGSLEKQVDQLQHELDRNEQALEELEEEQTTLEGARLEQQRLIGLQARAAYQGGRQEYLKLLLNQQQPETFSRTLTYYDYLARARLEQVESFNDTLRQLAAVEEEIETRRTALTEQKADLEARQERLAEVRQERRQVLARLDDRYSGNERKLAARQQERAQLERVLKTIEQTLARQAREAELARQRALAAAREAERQTPAAAPASPRVSSAASAVSGPFSQAKGRLPWPVDGTLMARYGTPRGGDARSTWDGVLIGAAAGTPVRAVHGGRVVFADWLRGAGLLVILDHGNGYLSLYGHNQSLLRNAGELVEAGEPIATVGTSGGQQSAALYFAIRQQGRPSDPAQWCRAQG